MLRVPMLAGWLFADLFLVLFIVALSSQPTVAASKEPSAPVSAHPRSARLPKHKEPSLLGLETSPQSFYVSVSPSAIDNPATEPQAAQQLVASLNSQLSGQHLLGRRAGFVLIFATSVTDASDPIDEAVRVGGLVIPILRKNDAATFATTSGEGLWGGAGDFFHFQIFFFAK
jgi:hypothetical protein